MTARSFAAVDLGASSGRVIVGTVGPTTLRLDEVHRFTNDPVESPDGLHWDIARLHREVLDGLRATARRVADLRGVAIDSWGCDYGLLDGSGELVGPPFHYRDPRTAAAVEIVEALVPAQRLYATTGLQFLPFNTIYQLVADRSSPSAATARSMAMIPDLLGYWLTGILEGEETNASTTGLLDPTTRDWARALIDDLGLPGSMFVPLKRPGDALGRVRDEVITQTGLPASTHVTHVGSHDTASAVVGVPAVGDSFAYIACGTWALVGIELDQPILTDASRLAAFTNELGVDGRVRYLHNVMGLWLLQESMRTWEREGEPADLAALLAEAAERPSGGPTFDPNDPSLLAPGDMPKRIDEALARLDRPAMPSRSALVRCILDSLAAAFAETLERASELSGRAIDVVHIVGGGSQNDLLCQLTADACERPVVAGPVEATAIGNVLVQARADGAISGDLEALRHLVRSTASVRRYAPRPGGSRREH